MTGQDRSAATPLEQFIAAHGDEARLALGIDVLREAYEEARDQHLVGWQNGDQRVRPRTRIGEGAEPAAMSESAAQGRCGRVVDPGAAYPHPCVLPEGHDPPCDGRSPEARSAAQDRCRAVTVKGDRCKRKALPGASPELCNEHQLRARRTTQPMVPRWAVAA